MFLRLHRPKHGMHVIRHHDVTTQLVSDAIEAMHGLDRFLRGVRQLETAIAVTCVEPGFDLSKDGTGQIVQLFVGKWLGMTTLPLGLDLRKLVSLRFGKSGREAKGREVGRAVLPPMGQMAFVDV